MSESETKSVTSNDLSALAKTARLDLTEERREAVAPALDGILQLFDALDAVDLGETPPTNSFDARWRNV